MITEIQAAKRALRDQHGFRPTGGTDEDPSFDFIPPDYYPVVIAGQLSRVEIDGHGNMHLDTTWDETARCEQMSLNFRWLLERVDAIHAALLPGKIATWQQRAEQSMEAAKAVAAGRAEAQALLRDIKALPMTWSDPKTDLEEQMKGYKSPYKLDAVQLADAIKAREAGDYDHPLLQGIHEELSIEIAELGIDRDSTDQEVETYMERRLDEILGKAGA